MVIIFIIINQLVLVQSSLNQSLNQSCINDEECSSLIPNSICGIGDRCHCIFGYRPQQQQLQQYNDHQSNRPSALISSSLLTTMKIIITCEPVMNNNNKSECNTDLDCVQLLNMTHVQCSSKRINNHSSSSNNNICECLSPIWQLDHNTQQCLSQRELAIDIFVAFILVILIFGIFAIFVQCCKVHFVVAVVTKKKNTIKKQVSKKDYQNFIDDDDNDYGGSVRIVPGSSQS